MDIGLRFCFSLLFLYLNSVTCIPLNHTAERQRIYELAGIQDPTEREIKLAGMIIMERERAVEYNEYCGGIKKEKENAEGILGVVAGRGALESLYKTYVKPYLPAKASNNPTPISAWEIEQAYLRSFTDPNNTFAIALLEKVQSVLPTQEYYFDMSNRSSSSSTRSQLTNASGTSNRNADSSSRIENHRNKNTPKRIVKFCDYTGSIDISDPRWTGRKLQSSVFSACPTGFDLKWRLEFSKQTYEGEFISITLLLDNEIRLLTSYPNGVSGFVELCIQRSDGSHVQKKKQNFVILNTDICASVPVLPRIGFSDPREHPYLGQRRQPSIDSQTFLFYCKVTYESRRKNLRENPISSLSNDLENLLINKQFGDAIIKVKDKEYPVYKGFLAARSPVFERMFRKDNGMLENTRNVVNISDLSPEVIEEMLLFIYTGKVKKLEKLVYQLLPAADKYELKGLMEICEETLIEQLSTDNVISILILAHEHNASWLKTEALQFVKSYSRSKDLKESKMWKVLTSSYRDLTNDVLEVLLDK